MNNLLCTDAYKFSMAMAGDPAAVETFYYSHRMGGPHYMPLDVEEFARSLLPRVDEAQYKRLAQLGWRMDARFKDAMERTGELVVRGLPRGSWFSDRAPAFSITGPSALVSWLEPTLLQLQYRVQVATLALAAPERLGGLLGKATCAGEREIALETFDSVGVAPVGITVAEGEYYDAVRARARALCELLGDPGRIFEVGMRAVSCAEQHDIALTACRDAGVRLTSNVDAADRLGLKAVGTMGHEHVQRHGDDMRAFVAMRDKLDTPVSYLLDTFSTLESGLPAAYRLISEDPARKGAVRFDSGDKEAQYLVAVKRAEEMGISPSFILEDGFDLELTRRFEALRERVGLPPERQLYGYGGYLVAPPWPAPVRNRVAAVWKLSCSAGAPTMKFADEDDEGKLSIPGAPVLYKVRGREGVVDVAAQHGEKLEHDGDEEIYRDMPVALEYSPRTRELMARLAEARRRQFEALAAA